METSNTRTGIIIKVVELWRTGLLKRGDTLARIRGRGSVNCPGTLRKFKALIAFIQYRTQ